MKNEKGFTMIELMLSFIVFLVIIVMFYSFLNNYHYKSSSIGDSLTAKTLLLKHVESESNEILLTDNVKEISYKEQEKVKKTLFTIDTSVIDVTKEFSYYSDKFKIYEVKSKVSWNKDNKLKTRSYEVKTYVNKISK